MLSFIKFVQQIDETVNLEEHGILGELQLINEKNYFNKVSSLPDQPWGKMPKSAHLKDTQKTVDLKSDDDKREYIGQVYDEYLPKMKKLESKLKSKLKSAAGKIGDSKVITDIKARKDLVSKVVDRNKKLEDITDFLRSTITVPSKEDMDKVTDGLFKQFPKVYEYAPKERGAGGYGYYGARHVLVDVDGVAVEVQLKPRKLGRYQKAAHKIYKATRGKEGEMSKKELEKVQSKSRRVFDRGNR